MLVGIRVWYSRFHLGQFWGFPDHCQYSHSRPCTGCSLIPGSSGLVQFVASDGPSFASTSFVVLPIFTLSCVRGPWQALKSFDGVRSKIRHKYLVGNGGVEMQVRLRLEKAYPFRMPSWSKPAKWLCGASTPFETLMTTHVRPLRYYTYWSFDWIQKCCE